LKKSIILNITGGTPRITCAIPARKKMVFDQKPPLQREQAAGSSLGNNNILKLLQKYIIIKKRESHDSGKPLYV